MIPSNEGILLVDKPRGKTSFYLVHVLRKVLGVKKIGHAGTLDPFATGVMVMLIGSRYTRLSQQFLETDKEYIGTLHLGITTDTYDCDGKIVTTSSIIPSVEEIHQALSFFQGTILQTPPMYSAKKIGGKKLYDLARQGKEIKRDPIPVNIQTELLHYHYPYLELRIRCSKGTYIRSIAYDLGIQLGCGAHLSALTRTRSGSFHLSECIEGTRLLDSSLDLSTHLIKPLSKPALLEKN